MPCSIPSPSSNTLTPWSNNNIHKIHGKELVDVVEPIEINPIDLMKNLGCFRTHGCVIFHG